MIRTSIISTLFLICVGCTSIATPSYKDQLTLDVDPILLDPVPKMKTINEEVQ